MTRQVIALLFSITTLWLLTLVCLAVPGLTHAHHHDVDDHHHNHGPDQHEDHHRDSHTQQEREPPRSDQHPHEIENPLKQQQQQSYRDDNDHHHHHKHHHECMHGDVQLDVQPSIEKARHHRRSRAALGSPAWAPIRITFVVNNLYNSSKYCNATGQRRPDFRGGTLTCRDVDILTDAKRAILTNTVLPKAVQLISERLFVIPWWGNLPIFNNQVCGNQTSVPENQSMFGIPNTDFAVYVTAGPIAANTTLAFASYCQLDPMSQRPLVGRANFNPMTIAWNVNATPGSEQEQANDRFVKTAVHELCHALGFTSPFFPLLQSPDEDDQVSPTFTSTVRGKPNVVKIRSPAVRAAGRRYHSCNSLDGVEIEDQGGAGTAGNHWERRTMRDELMAGVVGVSAISNFTLAFFHDLGFYSVNFSAAEPMSWGNNGTCGFVSQPCNVTAGGLYKEFCDPVTQTGMMCTADRTAVGGCGLTEYASPVPRYEQYYGNPNITGSVPLLDGCASIEEYSNLLCTDLGNPQQGDVTGDPRTGFVFSGTSRCIDTTFDFASGGLSLSVPARCLQVRCPGGVRVQIAVNSVWMDCPLNGSSAVMAPPAGSGFSGYLTCPAASEVCRDSVLFVAETTTTTTTTVPPTTIPSTTTRAPPPTTEAPVTVTDTNPPSSTTSIAPTSKPTATSKPTTTTTTVAPTPPPTTTTPPPSTTPLPSTATPKNIFNLFRFNFTCSSYIQMLKAYRQVAWSNISEAINDDVSLALGTESTTVIGITMLPSQSTIVALVVLPDTSTTTAQQTIKLNAWNQSLATPVVAGSLATLFRNSLGTHDFDANFKGICWPAPTAPAPNSAKPSAIGQVILSGNGVDFVTFASTVNSNTDAKLNAAVLYDVANALGTQPSFLFMMSAKSIALGSAVNVTFKVCLPDGLLVASPVSQWATEASNIDAAAMTQTRAAFTGGDNIAIASFAVAAPPPVVTTVAPATTEAPEGPPGKISSHCVLSTYNYCGVVELCVLGVIVVIALFFVYRCYRRSQQRKALEAKLKTEADAKAIAQLQQQRQKKLQNHLTHQLQYSRGGAVLNPVEPYMIDFSADPFSSVKAPPPPPVPLQQQQRGAPTTAIPLSPTIIPPPPQPQYASAGYTNVPTVPGRLHTFHQQPLAAQNLAKHNGAAGPRHLPQPEDDLEDIL